MIQTGSIIDLQLKPPFVSRMKFIALKRESDGEVFVRLLEPLMVRTRVGLITAPADFVSDGASIPRLAAQIVGDPFEFEFLHAAVIHDLLYRKGHYDYFSRRQADLVFRDLLWNTEVPLWKVPTFYAAVTAMGWKSYKKIKTIATE